MSVAIASYTAAAASSITAASAVRASCSVSSPVVTTTIICDSSAICTRDSVSSVIQCVDPLANTVHSQDLHGSPNSSTVVVSIGVPTSVPSGIPIHQPIYSTYSLLNSSSVKRSIECSMRSNLRLHTNLFEDRSFTDLRGSAGQGTEREEQRYYWTNRQYNNQWLNSYLRQSGRVALLDLADEL